MQHIMEFWKSGIAGKLVIGCSVLTVLLVGCVSCRELVGSPHNAAEGVILTIEPSTTPTVAPTDTPRPTDTPIPVPVQVVLSGPGHYVIDVDSGGNMSNGIDYDFLAVNLALAAFALALIVYSQRLGVWRYLISVFCFFIITTSFLSGLKAFVEYFKSTSAFLTGASIAFDFIPSPVEIQFAAWALMHLGLGLVSLVTSCCSHRKSEEA